MIKKINLSKYLSDISNSTWVIPFLFKKNPHWNFGIILPFLKKHRFLSYGSPSFNWNGGRRGELDLTNGYLKDSIIGFNKINIPCFTTFTNYFLVKEDLNDTLGNFLLEVLSSNPNNGVIVSSDTLYSYIKTFYPSLQLKCSILKASYENYMHRLEWYVRMLDSYDIVVTHPDIPLDILEKLPEKGRIEILINESCRKNCPNRRKCYLPYKDFSHHQSSNCYQDGGCTYSIDQVKYLYQLGFRHFKIQGR